MERGSEKMTQQLTKEQAVIISAYTGILCAPFGDVHEYIEKKLKRPVFTHEIPHLDLKHLMLDDFLSIVYVGEKE